MAETRIRLLKKALSYLRNCGVKFSPIKYNFNVGEIFYQFFSLFATETKRYHTDVRHPPLRTHTDAQLRVEARQVRRDRPAAAATLNICPCHVRVPTIRTGISLVYYRGLLLPRKIIKGEVFFSDISERNNDYSDQCCQMIMVEIRFFKN